MSEYQIRMIGELPEGWSLAPLGEIASDEANSFVDGPFGSDLKVSDYTEAGVRILQLQNLGDGEFVNKNKIYTSEHKARLLARCITQPGNIVIAKMAEPLARAVVVPPVEDKFLIVADLMKLRVSAKYDPIFVKNAINAPVFRREAERLSTGTTRTRISLSVLKKIGLPSPSLHEQRKIAKILSTVDNLIEKTQALIGKYQSVKQGMMQDFFTRGVDEDGQLRPSYEEAPYLYKESELGWIPKEWWVVFLDDVAYRGSGHTPSKSNPAYWNKGIKWVSLADSSNLDNLYINETDKEISEEGLANSSAVKHPEGTVILSRDAGIGKSAILGEKMAVSQHFMAWRCGDRLNNYYLYYWMQYSKPRFEAIAMGSTIKTIGLTFFRKLKVALAPKKEQDKAAAVLLCEERKLKVLDKELSKYKELKSGLMQDLLTGKVRVKVNA